MMSMSASVPMFSSLDTPENEDESSIASTDEIIVHFDDIDSSNHQHRNMVCCVCICVCMSVVCMCVSVCVCVCICG